MNEDTEILLTASLDSPSYVSPGDSRLRHDFGHCPLV
jgi:hypothetical protein